MIKPDNILPHLVTWHDKPASGWAIRYGKSKFLIAEGSGWARQVGLDLFKRLIDGSS